MSVSSERFGIRGAYAVAVMRFRFTDEDDVGRRPTGPPEVETKPQTSVMAFEGGTHGLVVKIDRPVDVSSNLIETR
jgi:hypothetical protein